MPLANYDFPRDPSGTVNNITSSNATTHTLNMPTGLRAGHLLLAFITFDGNPAVTWPAGWTELGSAANGSDVKSQVYYRVATGTEGATQTITTDAGQHMTCILEMISGHASSTTPPAISTAATGTSTSPNPGSLTPSGGAKNYLWYEAFGADDDSQATPFGSTNYTASQVTQIVSAGSAGDRCHTGVAKRDLNAATEDPGVMVLSASQPWVAWTVAVYPGTEGVFSQAVVEAVASSVTAVAGATHTVTLAGTDPGQLCVVAFTTDGAPTFTWPSGWTTLITDTANGAATKTGVRYKVRDASDGTTITITTSANEESAHQSWAFSGYASATSIEGAVATGSSANPDPPALTPTGGTKDYLWIIGWGADDDDEDPDRFHIVRLETLASAESTQSADSCLSQACYRDLYIDTLNMGSTGTFFMAASEEWVSYTLAVHPAVPVAEPGLPRPSSTKPRVNYLRHVVQ